MTKRRRSMTKRKDICSSEDYKKHEAQGCVVQWCAKVFGLRYEISLTWYFRQCSLYILFDALSTKPAIYHSHCLHEKWHRSTQICDWLLAAGKVRVLIEVYIYSIWDTWMLKIKPLFYVSAYKNLTLYKPVTTWIVGGFLHAHRKR